MRSVLYTQRVDVIESYKERRDCADQNIPRFLSECGYLPIPLPNVCGMARGLVEEIRPCGIVLTGGNSLCKYGGNAPERDEAERILIETALEKGIPVYGFCRGMQVILDYYGCKLTDVQGHIAVRHSVAGMMGNFTVNSYHSQACLEVTEALEILAQAEDGVVEAVRVKDRPILATMWHPEREQPFAETDITRVRALFKA